MSLSFFQKTLRFLFVKNRRFSLILFTDRIYLLFIFLTFLKRGAIDLKIKIAFQGIHIQYTGRDYASGKAKVS